MDFEFIYFIHPSTWADNQGNSEKEAGQNETKWRLTEKAIEPTQFGSSLLIIYIQTKSKLQTNND